ncbi:MAG: glycoside hydrolase family 3 C-terminal domain-containing protein [Clostridia bacterium]|nr:glycoside hydrolase family 3 C-terminal domain-containing protein [Clostridia bacterium]
MDIRKLLADMTLEEKLGQLTQLNAIFFKKDNTVDITGPVSRLGIAEEEALLSGSTLNFIGAKDMKEIQDIALAHQPHKIPLLFMQDVIHGYRTIYPIPLGMGCTFDEELVEECARMSGKEAAVSGVHVTFSPMLDLVRDARWGRVMESTGEDPHLNGRLGAAFVRGYQGDDLTGKYDIAACVKHFAAYGAPEAGRDYNAVEMSEHTLRETYLPGYRACIDAGVEMIMPSFNTVGGVPSTCNRLLLDRILRKEWQFDGIVISDYNAYREMIKHGVAEDDKHAAELAINAGCDIEMMSATTYLHAKELLDEGKITMEQIDRAVLRVLDLKDRLGLFENPYRAASEDEEKALHLCPAHRDLACRAAEEASVLLKNEGVLPFDKSVRKVAVIGPFAKEQGIKGFWACAGRDEDCVTVLSGIRALLPDAEVATVRGCSWELGETEVPDLEEAIELSSEADAVVLCLGEYQQHTGEGNSRATLTLSPAQMKLAEAVIKHNKNTAAVIFGGRPLVLTDLAQIVPAMLYVWQPGTEGGNAVANLLFGEVNPSGKLSMTFPYAEGQCPIYYSHMHTGRPVKRPKTVYEGGYSSRYLDVPVAPLYAFGHGLSYTTYAYDQLILSDEVMTPAAPLEIGVTVTNTGTRAGKETVQLYIRDKVASVARPVLELKDFAKLELAPGESAAVIFTLTEEDLAFHTADGTFAAERGEFEVFVGPNSEELLQATFRFEK